jgi:hypothetical protein
MTSILDDPSELLQDAVLVVVGSQSWAEELLGLFVIIIVFAGEYLGSVTHGVELEIAAFGVLADEDTALAFHGGSLAG